MKRGLIAMDRFIFEERKRKRKDVKKEKKIY